MKNMTLKHICRNLNLIEAGGKGGNAAGTGLRTFTTDYEAKVKKAIIDLLKDDGEGHHHKLYAERFAKYDFNIVPLKVDRKFTAAISFEQGIVYISEGFLTEGKTFKEMVNSKTFKQLNVVCRHELLHNFLCHEIRMCNKIGKLPYSKVSTSRSIHNLLNIIMDDEISNERYSDKDKETMKHLWLNGELITCLVTEEHRPEWAKLKLEAMYDKLVAELDDLYAKIISNRSDLINAADYITNQSLPTFMYMDMRAKSKIKLPIDKFLHSKYLKHASPHLKSLVQKLYDRLVVDTTTKYTIKDIESLMQQIANSKVTEEVNLIDPVKGDTITTKEEALLSPEYKWLIMQVLKYIKANSSKYQTWYDNILAKFDGSFTDEEIQDILASMK